MALNGAERRTLRAIEDALTEEEPGLALLLDRLGEAERTLRRVRRMTRTYLLLTVVLLLLGLLVRDLSTLGMAVLMLLMIPVVKRYAPRIVRRGLQ